MKFFPTVISLISLALGVEYVLSIRRVSAQVTKLTQEVRKFSEEKSENNTEELE